jgi:hypothetical protein
MCAVKNAGYQNHSSISTLVSFRGISSEDHVDGLSARSRYYKEHQKRILEISSRERQEFATQKPSFLVNKWLLYFMLCERQRFATQKPSFLSINGCHILCC